MRVTQHHFLSSWSPMRNHHSASTTSAFSTPKLGPGKTFGDSQILEQTSFDVPTAATATPREWRGRTDVQLSALTVHVEQNRRHDSEEQKKIHSHRTQHTCTQLGLNSQCQKLTIPRSYFTLALIHARLALLVTMSRLSLCQPSVSFIHCRASI